MESLIAKLVEGNNLLGVGQIEFRVKRMNGRYQTMEDNLKLK